MWHYLKFLGVILLMASSGCLAFIAATTFLTNLGLKMHDNYEHYSGTPGNIFVFGCTALGFLTSGAVVWYLNKHFWRVSLSKLLITLTVAAIILGAYAMSL